MKNYVEFLKIYKQIINDKYILNDKDLEKSIYRLYELYLKLDDKVKKKVFFYIVVDNKKLNSNHLDENRISELEFYNLKKNIDLKNHLAKLTMYFIFVVMSVFIIFVLIDLFPFLVREILNFFDIHKWLLGIK